MPVAPRPSGSQPLFERARKRVTQRLSLAGLNTAAPGTGKIKIPAAEAAVAPAQEPASAPVAQGAVEVPAKVLIPYIPEPVLLASAAELLASAQAEYAFQLPLATVLPMLPSGKIEVSLGDLATWAPQGVMHPLEALGEWASQMTQLPLPQIVMRIPPEMMVLRRDQKQIDTMVLSMDDPFSPEALKAKAEAARAAAEAAAASAPAVPPAAPEVEAPAVPVPEPEPAQVVPAEAPMPVVEAVVPESEPPVPAWPEPPATVPEFSPEMAATAYIAPPTEEPVAPAPTAADPALAVPPVIEEASTPEPDFSFTQTPEYQALLAKLNQVEGVSSAVESQPALAEVPVVSEAEPVVPPVPEAVRFSTPEEAEVPPPAGLLQSKPEPAPSPLDAAVKATPAGLGTAFSKALGELSSKKKAEPEPTLAAAVPTAVTEAASAAEMRALLKLPAGSPAEIKDVVHHIGLWPGVESCIVCGTDGLPIASFASSGRQGPPVAAIAPKLLKTLTTLFADLGRAEPEELVVPSGGETLHFFRHREIIMILGCSEAQIPAVYGQTIRRVLSLLSSASPKS